MPNSRYSFPSVLTKPLSNELLEDFIQMPILKKITETSKILKVFFFYSKGIIPSIYI